MKGLLREHDQRNEILLGWKELGMTINDIGIVADIDECYNIDGLNYTKVSCHPNHNGCNVSRLQVFESFT